MAAQSAIDGWAQTTSAAPSQRSRHSNNRPDYASLSGQTAALPTNGQLNTTLENATEVVLEKGKIHQVAVKKMHDFQEQHWTTYEDFKDLGVEVARPIADKYKKLFIHLSGDCNNIHPQGPHELWI